MSTADLSNVFGSGDSTANGITLDMLDYKYIDGCTNVKELEKILRVLRSGKEGYFPQLVQHCEDKLTKINPKSKVLRKENPITRSRDLPADELNDITASLNDWKKSIHDDVITNRNSEVKNIPPIRSAKTLKGDKVIEEKSEQKSKRIKGSDFRAWDKFDADAECEKVDSKESKPVVKNNKRDIPLKIDATGMSVEEIKQRIMSEKEKGNEAFKAGDYEEALAYYTRSINLDPLAATINNRALTYLRLKMWSEAEQDCNEVLKLEPDNLKAKLRRASSRKEQKNFTEAKEDLDFVLMKEPSNSRAQKILEEVVKSLPAKKGRKMKIAEVEEDDEEEDVVDNKPDNTQVDVKEITVNSNSKDATNSSKDAAKNPSPEASKNTSPNPIPEEPSTKPSPTVVETQTKPTVVIPKQRSLPDDVELVKTAGGNFFKQGQYASASAKYSLAIKKMESRGKIDLQSPYAHALALLYNNRAACGLKQGSDRASIDDCTKVLELKAMDVKALIRRATAYEHLEKYKEAYTDFRTAQTADWSATQAQEGANRTSSHLRKLLGTNWRDLITLPKVPSEVIESNYKAQSVKESTPPKTANKNVDNTKFKEPAKTNVVPPKETNITATNASTKDDNKKTNPKTSKKTNGTNVKKPEEKKPLSEMDEKRLKIKKNLYEKCKSDGNALFKKGNYEEAIKSYTKCMEWLPEEVASYTNRALCFLKLKKDISAINDCTEALKIEPNNVKAYFRRAQARKNLLQYHDAEADLKSLIAKDPKNPSALAELKVVQKLILERRSDTKTVNEEKKLPKRKLKIEEFSDSDDDVNEPKSTPFEEQKSGSPKPSVNQTSTNEVPKKTPAKNKPKTQQPSKTNNHVPEQGIKKKGKESKTNTNGSQPKKSGKKPLSNNQPMTPYEFGNQWNAIQPKTNVEAYKQIIDQTPVDKIPAMVSNKTNDHMILTFALIARRYIEENKAVKAFNVLNNLTKAQRFNMAAMFLSQKDKDDVSEVLDLLVERNGSKAVDQLRLDYMLL